MSDILLYLAVLAAAATPWLEVVLVVPAGMIAGLPVVPTVVVATVGNLATLAPVVLAGDRLRARVRRRRRGDSPRRDHSGGRARRLMDRYGLPGLALLGPVVTGAHVAALVAIAAGSERRATLVWLGGGVAAWAVAVGLLTMLGVDLLAERAPDLAAL